MWIFAGNFLESLLEWYWLLIILWDWLLFFLLFQTLCSNTKILKNGGSSTSPLFYENSWLNFPFHSFSRIIQGSCRRYRLVWCKVCYYKCINIIRSFVIRFWTKIQNFRFKIVSFTVICERIFLDICDGLALKSSL